MTNRDPWHLTIYNVVPNMSQVLKSYLICINKNYLGKKTECLTQITKSHSFLTKAKSHLSERKAEALEEGCRYIAK